MSTQNNYFERMDVVFLSETAEYLLPREREALVTSCRWTNQEKIELLNPRQLIQRKIDRIQNELQDSYRTFGIDNLFLQIGAMVMTGISIGMILVNLAQGRTNLVVVWGGALVVSRIALVIMNGKERRSTKIHWFAEKRLGILYRKRAQAARLENARLASHEPPATFLARAFKEKND